MLLVNAAAPIALLLAVPHNPQAADTCLSQYFYGTHGQQDVYITPDELCIAEATSGGAAAAITEGALVPLDASGVEGRQLVWLQHDAEQGLYGSRYYAREMREAGANLTLMVQADMLAYHAPGEPAQLGLPDRIGTPEVTQLVANLSAIYSPELTVGFTPACCSDHQSFHNEGFPATQVFERAGPIADPMYHNSGDLSERDNYDFEQLKSIAKVQFATLLHVAGFDLEEDAE
ncbi:hypothetical protein FKP32DRAFT_1600273 [Trametes sanguinea]|nr:hypothetical protein FKP32DRAFT_1600273 [Trametes sanguinea]